MSIVVPEAPNFEILKNITTTNSLVCDLKQTFGGKDNFEIYCNSSKMTNIEIDGSLYTINNLRPGTIYNCHATTILCGHMSAESRTVEECTGLYKYI